MIEIIPAIDIIGGECVRLSQGDYDRKKSYFKDPSEVARRYEDIGIRRLHVVDLDGAKQSMPVNLKAVEKICTSTSLDVQFGGGIKTKEAIETVYNTGVRRAICGSVAIKEPVLFAEWIKHYGADRVILGADIKNGYIAVNGWLEESKTSIGEITTLFLEKGVSQMICTDISKDGMLQGPNFQLYDSLQREYPAIDITVSGGISSMDDIMKLNEMSLRSVIVGKAIYEGHITLKILQEWLQNE